MNFDNFSRVKAIIKQEVGIDGYVILISDPLYGTVSLFQQLRSVCPQYSRLFLFMMTGTPCIPSILSVTSFGLIRFNKVVTWTISSPLFTLVFLCTSFQQVHAGAMVQCFIVFSINHLFVHSFFNFISQLFFSHFYYHAFYFLIFYYHIFLNFPKALSCSLVFPFVLSLNV